MHRRLRGLVRQQGEVTRAQSLAHGANPQSETCHHHPRSTQPRPRGSVDHMGFWQSPHHGDAVHLMEETMSRRSRLHSVALIATLGLLVSGCGSDEPSGSEKPEPTSPPPPRTPSAKAEPTKKEPAAPRSRSPCAPWSRAAQGKVNAGKAFTLRVVADEPGELHVHSTPEQEIEFGAGTRQEDHHRAARRGRRGGSRPRRAGGPARGPLSVPAHARHGRGQGPADPARSRSPRAWPRCSSRSGAGAGLAHTAPPAAERPACPALAGRARRSTGSSGRCACWAWSSSPTSPGP